MNSGDCEDLEAGSEAVRSSDPGSQTVVSLGGRTTPPNSLAVMPGIIT